MAAKKLKKSVKYQQSVVSKDHGKSDGTDKIKNGFFKYHGGNYLLPPFYDRMDEGFLLLHNSQISDASGKALSLLGRNKKDLRGLGLGDIFLDSSFGEELKNWKTIQYSHSNNQLPLQVKEIPLGPPHIDLQLFMIKNAPDEKKRKLKKRKCCPDSSSVKLDQKICRFFIEHSSEGCLLLRSGNVIYANSAVSELFGYSPEEMRTLHLNGILKSIHPFEREKAVNTLQVFNGEDAIMREEKLRIIDKEGLLRWIELKVFSIELDEDDALFIIINEITRRKDAEDSLKESERKFRTTFDYAAFGMAIMSTEGKFLKINNSLGKLLGYTENQLLEMNISETIHLEDREAYLELMTDLISKRRDYGWIEERLIRKDNRTIWVLNSTTIVRDDDENIPLYLISHVQDITERKYAEEVLKSTNRELEARVKLRTRELKELIEQSPYAIGIFRSNGKIIEHNDVWQTLFGSFAGIQVSTWNLFDMNILVSNGFIPQIKELLQEGGKIKTNPLLFTGMELEGESEENRMLIFHIYTILGFKKSGLRLVVMVEDVTESELREDISRELDLQRRHSAAIIEVLERERKRISRELHDVIGQQLLVAKLNLEFYIKHISPSDVKLKETKDKIIDMSKEIRGIIHSLHPAEIDKYGLMDAIELLTHHFNEESGIECETVFTGDARFISKKNEVHIYRIIQEALNNISKHSQASRVVVNVAFEERKVIGSVKDNGIGFELSRMQSNKTPSGGFGLMGMSERARILGGSLKILSVKDTGTEIIFEIPNSERVNG